MQATLTTDELPVVEGFNELLDRVPAPEDELSRARLDELHQRLDEAGWLEAALADAELAQPFWVLTALAEAAGTRDVPLAYPLLESWVAVRALGEAYDGVLTLAPDLLWRAGGDTGAVPFAGLADAILVPDGSALHIVSAGELTRGARLDDTMPIWSFTPELGEPVATLEPGAASALRAQYLTLQCAEMVGSADRLFRRAVAYLKDREQFGRRLSAFQALQHRAADALTALETARSLTYYAAWACEISPEHAEPYALMAKAHAGQWCWWIANEVIQLHGGIGFTWEAGLQYNTGRIVLRSLAGLDPAHCAAESGLAAIQTGAMIGMLE